MYGQHIVNLVGFFFSFSFGCRVQGKERWTWEEWEVSMNRVHCMIFQIINKDIILGKNKKK